MRARVPSHSEVTVSHGWVSSLAGENVVFTGIVRREGEWVHRDDCFALALAAGAALATEGLNPASTLLVQGDLSTKQVSDTKTGYSQKLTKVAEWRRARYPHVHVIDSAGFFALVDGHQARCRDLVGTGTQVRIKREVGDDVFGGLLVPHAGERSRAGGPLTIDLSGLDAGLKAHQNTLRALIERLGDVPVRTPGPGAPQFDAGWSRGKNLFVAEVKSLSGTNEAQQIRLGLGQVLDYHHQLKAKSTITPVLVLERQPQDDRWVRLCKRHGVLLVWGPNFTGV